MAAHPASVSSAAVKVHHSASSIGVLRLLLLAVVTTSLVNGESTSWAMTADDECASAASSLEPGGDAKASEEGACAANALQRRAVGRQAGASDALSALETAAAAFGVDAPPSNDNADGQLSALLQEEEDANGTIMQSGAAVTAYSCSMIPWKGPNFGAESCFCHKAGNPSCRSLKCSCREGCSGIMMAGYEGVTFRNTAWGNCPHGALLTVPRTYVRDINHLSSTCGGGAHSLLSGMLSQGFSAYQARASGPVMQCVHKGWDVSVHWLHLHTFCAHGHVDGMPSRNVAYCSEMSSIGQAGEVASKFLHWSR